MTFPEYLDLPPLMSAKGTVRLPGSKSISNRVLLLAALSEGVTEVDNLLRSDDTGRMLEALQILGVEVEWLRHDCCRIVGCGGDFPNKRADLFLGNAGTAFRPLAAVLAFAGGDYRLFGGTPGTPGGRMHERPIRDLVEAMRQLGAHIEYLGEEGFPPLRIAPATPVGEQVLVRGDVSSQFLTGILMALPLLGRPVMVGVVGELISKPYIEITLAMMKRFGVEVSRQGEWYFAVAGNQRYRSPGKVWVEGDASSASYFLAAGAIGGGPVRVEGVGRDSVQGDVRFAEALHSMGARLVMGANWVEVSRPEHGRLKAIDLDCNAIPDAAMTLAVVALFAEGTTTLRNIASWRVKETDRIAAMATELRKVGAIVEEGPDDLRITPPSEIKRAAIDTYDDHRMAMCFSLAAFGSAGIRINDPGCVAKTFPGYFTEFKNVVQAVPVIAIDGPSASGKGTVAQRVAEVLGMHYLDSGALYRLLGLAAQRHGVALDDEAGLVELADKVDIRFKQGDAWLDGVRVGEVLRTEEVGAAASRVAALPKVRAALLDRQRAFRRPPGLVADGRDMASVVFPDAVLKIFLTASVEARAERRYKQLKEKGMDVSMRALLQDIQARDERDAQRNVAPLQQAQGAVLLDTTTLGIEQAVREVLERYRAVARP